MINKLTACTLFLVLFTGSLVAQEQDSIPGYNFSISTLTSSAGTVPFWLVHGQNGKYTGNGSEILAIADVHIPYRFGKKWQLTSGMQLIGKGQTSESYLHEAYINLSYGPIELKAGKEEFTAFQYSEDLGIGSYNISNNARPIPRVGIGIYEYADVPFTNGYLQVKGYLHQSFLNDDRGPKGTDATLFHEKAAYARFNKLPVNLHFGINHSALFGGTRPDGTEIPVDYKAVFFAQGSDKVGEVFAGEATNVAGAHLGLVDIGVNFESKDVYVQTYIQKPFKDQSGYINFMERNRDHIFGFVVRFKNFKYVEEFVYENYSTLWQSGPGAPDPVINGNSYAPGQRDDLDEILNREYGLDVEGTTEDEFWRFVERMENYGYPYGGRDDYYNNGLYYRGWSYNGMSIGTPLFLTEQRVMQFNPGFDGSYDRYFVNNRVRAYHLGVKGTLSDELTYKAKWTWTKNYGTHFGLNQGFSGWESKDPDSDYFYYFDPELSQTYVWFDFEYTPEFAKNWYGNLSLGADWGQMYHSYGFQLGIGYSGTFNVFNHNDLHQHED